MISILENQAVKHIITAIVGGCQNQTATVQQISFVKLYNAASKKQNFEDTNISGIIVLTFDRREGGCEYIRIYDLSNLRILFSMELCYGINEFWVRDENCPNFCYLPLFKGFIGFLFPDAKQAENFSKQIQLNGPTLEELAKEIQNEKSEQQKLQKEKEKEKGFLKSLLKIKQSDQSTSTLQFENQKIVFQIQFGEIKLKDLNTNFINVFQKAQITKKDLQNPLIAKQIFKSIATFNQMIQKQQQASPQRKSLKGSGGSPTPSAIKDDQFFNIPARLRPPRIEVSREQIPDLLAMPPNHQLMINQNTQNLSQNHKIINLIEETTNKVFQKKNKISEIHQEKLMKEIEKYTGLQCKDKEFSIDLSNLTQKDLNTLQNLLLFEIKQIKDAEEAKKTQVSKGNFKENESDTDNQ